MGYNLRFYDTSIELVGELDDAYAIIWPMKFRGFGMFKLYFSVVHSNCFQQDYYVKLDLDKYKTGVITGIEISEDENVVLVKGYTLSWLLSKRITVPPAGSAQYTYSGQAAYAMTALVDANAGPGAAVNRRLGITLELPSISGYSVSVATRYKTLSDELTAIGEQTGLGYTIYLDTEVKELVFEVLEGTDRTWNQSNTKVVCFSPDYDNVMRRKYQKDKSVMKNCAYVGGQGEGADRAIAIVGDSESGLARHEIFVDARDISDASALTPRGEAKLAGYPAVDCYGSDVDAAGFESKWFLGDFVSVKDSEYGVSANYQVTEVTISIDKDARLVTPVFGASPKLTSERIDQISNTMSIE